MKTRVYSIYKEKKDEFSPLLDNYSKLIKNFTEFEDSNIFSKNIDKAQKVGAEQSKKSYTEALEPKLGGFNIALDETGISLTSKEFSELLKDRQEINFFIGGSYGFEKEFTAKCHKKISLGKSTLPHRLAKVVLLEQIYRGFTILNNHPYHKE
ncbi:MAG: 23S rRNA (pseudouridine(1915)-N(3))-methyltransferase RlmH [Campylobacterales bacterium]|nr:23S rRNA (pseudouridine(1915)-N(3))-methyltransferase RlmH [Campylobacterales bacterium]